MSAVFVSGFDFGTPESTVESHFSTIAPVKAVRLVGRGNAVVTYESSKDARRAVNELNYSNMEGNRRYVKVKIDQGGKGKGKDGKDAKGYGGYGKSYFKGSDKGCGKKGYGKGGYGKGKGKGGGGRAYSVGEMGDDFVATFDEESLEHRLPAYDAEYAAGYSGLRALNRWRCWANLGELKPTLLTRPPVFEELLKQGLQDPVAAFKIAEEEVMRRRRGAASSS